MGLIDRLTPQHDRIGLLLVGASLVMATAACASSASPHAAPSASSSKTSAATQVSYSADPDKTLSLPDVEKVFFAEAGKSGSKAFAPIAVLPKGTAELGVVCSGSGDITVSVAPMNDYQIPCGGPLGQLEIMSLSSAKKNVVVSVTSRATATWALSFGWSSKSDPSPQ